MKVTFDSNVWENIVSPDSDKPSVYESLSRDICNNVIEPYFCEIALSLESIFKSDRLSHTSTYKPKIEVVTEEFDGNHFHGVVGFGPDNDAHPGMHPALAFKYSKAVELGFKVITMTNIGTARAKEIQDKTKVNFSSIDEFWAYADRLNECSKFIESLGCGSSSYHKLVEHYGIKMSPYKRLAQMASKTEIKKFAASVAEWADGDSISAHYAFGNDYFCTNDQARNAGSQSVFHSDNLRLVAEKFGVQVISPEELVNLTKHLRRIPNARHF
ncbi:MULTISPECIES: hypothetical protein [Vibrio]|uniref:Uncharacterized protein n=2 Tax=Vibrio parahaemolyticus TaxID=670 RepID=A0AAX0MJM4_VIBPH|nr:MULTISPECIES: hypothetical protein [Vibrio]ASZ52289.1 hypothetical protein YA91_17905 [Vibrio parahaemolyticus]AUT87467.1 hypothetical protein RK51_012045 [Vibrio parahaemolyticus]EGF43700.1 hypothetical protein VP10329_19260 [Vibrio parahaemolyticus 10329]EGQ7711203.1 hypothetical protein [Vibrio parahaemolyticus]EGQ7773877.1 hypothetical protein [Vibrio parahaemolyticus]